MLYKGLKKFSVILSFLVAIPTIVNLPKKFVVPFQVHVFTSLLSIIRFLVQTEMFMLIRIINLALGFLHIAFLYLFK